MLAVSVLCSGVMLSSCTDDIQNGTLDESQYDNVKELKGAVRLNRKRFWGSADNEDKLAAYQTLYEVLKDIAILAAPIAPFYMDQLYLDLVPDGEESVHYVIMPSCDESVIDKDLEERMELAQRASSMVSTAFGSLAMMTSVLVSPDGKYEYEAAHGTVTRHYYKYLKGEETSTNPMATIFAWSGAFRKRGELDNLPELINYADQLEAACLDTLNEGIVTKDLANLMEGVTPQVKNSADFMAAIRERLEKRLA